MNYIPENVIEPIKNKIRILEIGCINAKIAKQIALLSCEPSKEKREYIAACFSKKFAAKSSKYIHKKVYLGKRITRNTGYSLWPEGDTPDQIILNGDGFKSAADVKKALIFFIRTILEQDSYTRHFPAWLLAHCNRERLMWTNKYH